MNSSTNYDDEVSEDDGTLASDPLAEDESHNGTESAADIIDGCDKAGHCWVRIAKGIFEALAAQNAAEESLVIFESR